MGRIFPSLLLAAAAAVSASPAQACAPLSIFFDWNSARLSPASLSALERFAVNLAWKGPDLDQVVLTSHTDRSGSPTGNRRMAMRRAEAVRDVLLANNVPARLIGIRIKGDAQPRVRTAGNVREPRNRRVELMIQLSAEAQARQLREGRPIC